MDDLPHCFLNKGKQGRARVQERSKDLTFTSSHRLCLFGRRKKMGKVFQFSRVIFLPYSSAKLGGRESWEPEEERVMNFKCLTWDLHDCLKRDLFINDKSSESLGKGGQVCLHEAT